MSVVASPSSERCARRGFLRLACASALLGARPRALAQAYPARPIRLVVDAAPGGLTDLLARVAADGLSKSIGQAVVVDNRAGASGSIAGDVVVKAPADGYTLLFASSGNICVQPLLKRALPYDPVTDLVPVFNVADAPHLFVVSAALPVTTLAEFVRYAEARPGRLFYGSPGIGTAPHLSVELFQHVTGTRLEHVPYKANAAAVTDFLGGRLQVLSNTLGSARSLLASGAARALAVGAGTRLTDLPAVPTSAEAGVPGWRMSNWFGVFAPKGTPAGVVRLLDERLQVASLDPAARRRIVEAGAERGSGSQPLLAARMRGDFRLWGELVRDANISLE